MDLRKLAYQVAEAKKIRYLHIIFSKEKQLAGWDSEIYLAKQMVAEKEAQMLRKSAHAVYRNVW